jgi:hypothetical protein
MRWRDLVRVRTDVPLDFTCSELPTAPLPAPRAVCAALGLVR